MALILGHRVQGSKASGQALSTKQALSSNDPLSWVIQSLQGGLEDAEMGTVGYFKEPDSMPVHPAWKPPQWEIIPVEKPLQAEGSWARKVERVP